jgi:type IV pilus assembly protein PilW
MTCLNTYKKIKLTSQSGIGLIELLVSMLIGLFIMGGVLQLFSTSSQNAVAVSGSSRIQENVRFAFSRIADDITQSGNLGCISSSVAIADFSTNNPVTSQAITLASDPFSFLAPIRISDAPASEDGTGAAPANGRAPGTDEFSIGYIDNAVRLDVNAVGASDVTVTPAALVNAAIEVNDIVSVGNCYQAAIFAVTARDNSTGVISHVATFDKEISSSFKPNDGTVNVVSPFYLYGGKTGAYEYSIGKSAAAADCIRGATPQDPALGQANCALFRSDARTGARQELAQGIHDIQVDYGWTDSAGNLLFANAPTTAQLALVDRMRVTMRFNSIDNVNTVGNNIDQTANGLIVKTYSRTFNIFNRL